MLFLFLLVGVTWADLPEKCLQAEFEANARFTGQNIDLNLAHTALLTEGDVTKLRVSFYVPRRYTEQYDANAFAITFNRALQATTPDGEDERKDFVGQDSAEDQSACYSNRYDNYTYCDNSPDGVDNNEDWTIEQNNENDCVMDMHKTFLWSAVMDTAFGKPVIQNNGRFTEVYLTATVETWTHFRDYTNDDYQGQMTGDQEFLDQGQDDQTMTNRNGKYGGDGGWRGVGDPHNGKFGPLVMDDERYTLYQIPFILRFPRTVMVQASFKAASPIAVLSGVIAQDVISVNKNPGDGVFAVLEAVLTTQVQYPYGVRAPADGDNAGMTVIVGGNGDHAAGIEFIEWDHEASCGDVKAGEMCEQKFKVRITPSQATPCTVAGLYTFEMWMQCVNHDQQGVDGCALDDLLNDDALETRQQSNAYLTETINIAHQPFCPQVVDEVRVVGDFNVYHDESFETAIGGPDQVSVYTNDILFYEASYRTTSAMASSFDGFEENDSSENAVGNDEFIDFVRATKIFMDVTIGENSEGDANDFDPNNWDDNFDFKGDTASGNPLGATRIPGTDITGADSDELSVTVGEGDGDAAVYQIELCSVATLPANEITFARASLFDANDVLKDCFTEKNGIATDFLDFNKVMSSLQNSANTIDENEVAFKLRMDERIIPLKKATDNSFVKLTIQAEVYYKGNRQPTRRLLQADFNDRNQKHSMSTSHSVYPRGDLQKCNVAAEQEEGVLHMSLAFGNADDMPSAAVSLDWAAGLSHQLESYLGVQGVVKVAELAQCNEEHKCQTIYVESRAPRRRLDNAAYLKVDLKIESSKDVSAGLSINKLQEHIINRRSEIHLKVQAFRKADVTRMEVEDCNKQHELNTPIAPRDGADVDLFSAPPAERELESESSAAAVSTLMATLVGLWAMRL